MTHLVLILAPVGSFVVVSMTMLDPHCSGYRVTGGFPNSRNDFVGFRLYLRSKSGAPTTLAAPTALNLTAGNTMLAVSWESTPGSDNTTLYWSQASGNSLLTSANTVTVTGNTYLISGLTNGTTVYAAVRANVGGNLGFMSSSVSASASAVGGDHLLVDISAGSAATSYPISIADLTSADLTGAGNFAYKSNLIVLKRIPAGSFTMGNTTAGASPEHTVNITEDFYAGVFEVTQLQWLQVMGSYPTGSQDYNNSGTNTDPVHRVSWEDIRGSATGSANWYTSGNTVDANTFMGNLLAKTGLGFDLPTEAEWEYSCRAGTVTDWSYGNTENGDYMWYTTNNTPTGTKEVGGKLPNPWGLYDIHGNAYEWCLDWHDASYYSSLLLTIHLGPIPVSNV